MVIRDYEYVSKENKTIIGAGFLTEPPDNSVPRYNSTTKSFDAVPMAAPFIFQGAISVPADFPTSAAVQNENT